MLRVPLRQDRLFDRDPPVDLQGRVVPQDAALVLRRIIVRYLVEDLRVRLQRHETMRKTDRDEDQLPVFRADDGRDVSAERRAAATDVYRDIEDRAGDGAHEFALGFWSDLV